MFFNPTDETLSQWIRLPLYYTGATDKVVITLEGTEERIENLHRDFSVVVSIGKLLILSLAYVHKCKLPMSLSHHYMYLQSLDQGKSPG